MTDKRWDKVFGRHETVESVLEYVVAHWYVMQKRPAPDMLFAQTEPKITRYFCESLLKNAKHHGVFGIFIPERPVADLDEVKQRLESRGRTDITYFTNANNPTEPIEFVMEFKKLKSGTAQGNSSRRAYCADGMARFVDGIYARDYEVGFMVGLIASADDMVDATNGLKRAIQQPDMVLQLKAIDNPNGKKTVTTKKMVFKTCDFETRHARDHVNQPDVLLGHIVLAHQT